MNTEQAFEIAQAILLSLGGGAAIVFGLSNWLGKIWAYKLMAAERTKNEEELEHLKTELKETLEQTNINYRHKIDLYKTVSIPIVDLIVLIEHTGNLSSEQLVEFDKQRLLITTQLAMFAPNTVFNKFNDFIDYIYNSIEGKEKYSFATFRELALEFFSEIRKDIGIYSDDVAYSGSR